VLPLYAIGLPAALLFFVVPIQTPFLLTERGFGSPQLIGQVAAIGGIGVTAGGFLFKSLDRLSLFQNLTIAFVLIASGLGIFAGADSYLLTVVGVIVASLGCGMTLPAILTSLMNALSFNERGRGTGGWQTVFFVGNFLSPISVLAATALLGGLETALLALAVLSGAGAVLCLLASRPARGGGEARMVAADE
jgi:sugar phosphate permease